MSRRLALVAAAALGIVAGAVAAPPAIDPTARGLAQQAAGRDAIPAVSNYNDAYLAHYTAVCGQVRTGDARCKIAVIGDSTTAGWGAGSGGGQTGARARSWPSYLAKALTAAGLPATADTVFGTAAAGTLAAYSLYDPRVSFSGGSGAWGLGVFNVPGGVMFMAAASVTQAMAFTPTGTVDRFTIWYPTNGGLGALQAKIDGGTATTISEAGYGFTSTTVSAASPGTHTLTLTGNGAGPVYVAAIDAWNSTSPAATVANMGWAGSWVENWVSTTQPWETGYAVPAYAPALTIVVLGINSWTGASGTTQASFASAYQTLLTGIRNAGSDCMLVVPFPSAATSAPLATQASYAQTIAGLAKANNCVLVDLPKRFGGYAQQTALGGYFDALHPKAQVYAATAQLIAAVLTR